MNNYAEYLTSDSFNIDTDVDLSREVTKIIYGNWKERPKGTLVVLQKLVRNEDGLPVKSPWVHKNTGEGLANNRGPNTTREGYSCNEKLIRVLYRPASRMIMDEQMNATGMQPVTRDVMYFAKEDAVEEHDCIVFVKLDDNGKAISPITPEKEVVITKKYAKRLDNGLLQFYTCIVEEQK